MAPRQGRNRHAPDRPFRDAATTVAPPARNNRPDGQPAELKNHMKKPPRPRLAVVIADIHAGSTVGLLPPGFVTKEGNEVKQNPLQEWLWACWQRANEFVSR